MILDPFTRTARHLALATLLASGLTGLGLPAASAQTIETTRAPGIETPDVDVDADAPDADTPDVEVPRLGAPAIGTPRPPQSDGSLVFHGNYCGPGSRGAGLPPVDALDEACMHHDACSPPVGQGLPSCGCNARLTREAALIARSPRTPDDLRITAGFVSEGAKIMACR